MIFVTVGAQMPFDRLVKAVDRWAGESGNKDVFAQIGPAAWEPQFIRWTHFLNPPEYREYIKKAHAIVAHAGMGSIITALEQGKEILVLPRRGDLKETRNDHQVATAKQFLAQGRIRVAFTEEELIGMLDQLECKPISESISNEANPQLINSLKSFIQGSSVEDLLAS